MLTDLGQQNIIQSEYLGVFMKLIIYKMLGILILLDYGLD